MCTQTRHTCTLVPPEGCLCSQPIRNWANTRPVPVMCQAPYRHLPTHTLLQSCQVSPRGVSSVARPGAAEPESCQGVQKGAGVYPKVKAEFATSHSEPLTVATLQTSSGHSWGSYLRSRGGSGTRSDQPGCGKWPRGGRAGMHTHRCPARSEGPGTQAHSSSGSHWDLGPGSHTEHRGSRAEWHSPRAPQARRCSRHCP